MKLDIDLTPAHAERLREEAERLKTTSPYDAVLLVGPAHSGGYQTSTFLRRFP